MRGKEEGGRRKRGGFTYNNRLGPHPPSIQCLCLLVCCDEFVCMFAVCTANRNSAFVALRQNVLDAISAEIDKQVGCANSL